MSRSPVACHSVQCSSQYCTLLRCFWREVFELSSKWKMLASQAASLFFDVGATFGLVLVVYGVITKLCNAPWPCLDAFVRWASPIATITASILVVASIYIPPNPTPPKTLTKFIVAPFVLAMLVIAAIVMVVSGKPADDSILLGFSISTMFGSLMRLIPRLHEKFDDPSY